MAEYIVEKHQTSGGWTWAEPKGELIRCKDCANWNTDDDMHRCFVWCVYTSESGYCHRAKKKEPNTHE